MLAALQIPILANSDQRSQRIKAARIASRLMYLTYPSYSTMTVEEGAIRARIQASLFRVEKRR